MLGTPDPADEILSASLHQYAKEHLSTDQRLLRLKVEHNLEIKCVLRLNESTMMSFLGFINMSPTAENGSCTN
jgi:hypothetical protein